jgi:hypothetical protein
VKSTINHIHTTAHNAHLAELSFGFGFHSVSSPFGFFLLLETDFEAVFVVIVKAGAAGGPSKGGIGISTFGLLLDPRAL